MGLRVKRVYEKPGPRDGYRILVDRLWPRGLAKEAAALDDWRKELAPSDTLRKWFAHDPARWPEFRRKYLRELRAPGKRKVLSELRSLSRKRTVTLLFAAKDEERNNARVLEKLLKA